MELPKIENPNFTPKKGIVALSATITAIALGGCGFWDERREPIVIPNDATERVDGGGDRAFIMEDSEVNRIVLDCGKAIKSQHSDTDNTDPEFIELEDGKMLGICEDVDTDWPVRRLEK